MQRLEDWPTRLAEFIEARQERAFSWGGSDCCLFVCDAIEAMTGTDPGARWRGIYSSEKGARRVLRDNDGVAGIAALVLGQPVPPALASRGDVVLVNTLQGEALGICLGSQIAAQGPDGIVCLPIGRGTRAWHV